jgi:hypothetical protein
MARAAAFACRARRGVTTQTANSGGGVAPGCALPLRQLQLVRPRVRVPQRLLAPLPPPLGRRQRARQRGNRHPPISRDEMTCPARRAGPRLSAAAAGEHGRFLPARPPQICCWILGDTPRAPGKEGFALSAKGGQACALSRVGVERLTAQRLCRGWAFLGGGLLSTIVHKGARSAWRSQRRPLTHA